jgi:hypothetical protein
MKKALIILFTPLLFAFAQGSFSEETWLSGPRPVVFSNAHIRLTIPKGWKGYYKPVSISGEERFVGTLTRAEKTTGDPSVLIMTRAKRTYDLNLKKFIKAALTIDSPEDLVGVLTVDKVDDTSYYEAKRKLFYRIPKRSKKDKAAFTINFERVTKDGVIMFVYGSKSGLADDMKTMNEIFDTLRLDDGFEDEYYLKLDKQAAAAP